MATHLPRAQMTLPAGCLTCVLTRSWWFTHTIISSAASPLSHSLRVAAYCWLAMTISTATSGTLWRPTVQVGTIWSKRLELCECDYTSLTNVNYFSLIWNIHIMKPLRKKQNLKLLLLMIWFTADAELPICHEVNISTCAALEWQHLKG